MNRVLLSVMGLAVMLWACPEKKTEAPKPVEPVKPAPKPEPLPEAQPRADKECAAPLDPGPAADVTIGARAAKTSGSKLTFADKDADGTFTLEPVYCLGLCAQSPACMLDDEVYARMTPQRLERLLHAAEGDDVAEQAPA